MTKKISYKKDQNWFDNNPFFTLKKDYDEFTSAMMTAAENGGLPIALQHEEPETITISDIKQFLQRFKRDTGLDLEVRAYTCNNCDKLHCLLIVSEHSGESDYT